MRTDNRLNTELRKIKFSRNYTKHAEGSVLVEFGDTCVLCNASIEKGVPPFLRDSKQGWITAEYSMLPRATGTRSKREAVRGKQTGRTIEIQRLIGRSLRAAVDMTALGEYTITIDCDVLQADGGTRTAAINGGCVALFDAIKKLKTQANFTKNPFKQFIAAISVGIANKKIIVDLDYNEDSNAETDMNLVMTENLNIIEIQGTAEQNSFSANQLTEMITVAQENIKKILAKQKNC